MTISNQTRPFSLFHDLQELLGQHTKLFVEKTYSLEKKVVGNKLKQISFENEKEGREQQMGLQQDGD